VTCVPSGVKPRRYSRRGMRAAGLLGLGLALLVTSAARGAVLVYQDRHTNDILAAYATGSQARVIAHGHEPFVSPDGRRVAFFKRATRQSNDDLYVVSTKGGRPRLVARGAWTQTDPRSQMWSPDSRHLVVGDVTGYAAFLVDVVRRTRRVVPLDSFGGVSFSPSGKQFAIVDDHGRGADIYVLRSDGSHSRHLAAEAGWPVWGRPGIAFATGAGVVLKPGPGKRGRRLASARPIAWSVDGSVLLGATRCDSVDSCRALLIDPTTGATRELPFTFTPLDGLSRDGSLVLGEMDGNVVSARADGTNLRVLAREATAATWTR
jgi:hypothetical protein